MQERSAGGTCSLQEGGRLSQPVNTQPANASSTDSKSATGTSSVCQHAGSQQVLGAPSVTTQQQQVHNSEGLPAPAPGNQSCSVPADLEVMDQLFDELVMLDPNFSAALAHAPPIQFETFVAAHNGSNSAVDTTTNDTDIHKTFLTACEVPESQLQEIEDQPNGDKVALVCTQTSNHPAQRHPSVLGQPNVAASADLFTWKVSSQSGSGARLHNMNFEPAVQQQSLSGGTGVRWADGGYVSVSGGAHDHNPRNHRCASPEDVIWQRQVGKSYLTMI